MSAVPHASPRRAWPQAEVVAFVLGTAALLAHAAYYYWWMLDDAFISFRYAENLVRHGALEYNLGERVEGFSNLLWTLQMAAGEWLGAEMIPLSRALGLTSALGLLALTLGLHRSLTRQAGCGRMARAAGATLLALWMATSTILVTNAQSGLETAQHALLAGLAFAAAIWAGQTLRTGWFALCALAASLLMLSRPEGFGYYPFIVLTAALQTMRGWSPARVTRAARLVTRRGRWVWFCLPILTLAALFAWRWVNFGALFPLTVGSKAAWANHGLTGLKYVLASYFYRSGPLWYLPAAAGTLAVFAGGLGAGRRVRRALAGLVLLLTANVLFAVKVGGDFMGFSRFMVPSVLPNAVLLCLPAALAFERVRRAATPARRRWMALAALAFTVSAGGLAVRAWGVNIHQFNIWLGTLSVSPKTHTPQVIGEGLRHGWVLGYGPLRNYHSGLFSAVALNRIAPGGSVVAGDIGQLGIVLDDVRILDYSGLVTVPYGRLLRQGNEQTRATLLACLDAQQPDWLILPVQGGGPVLAHGLPASDWPAFARDYEPMLSLADWGGNRQSTSAWMHVTAYRRRGAPLPTAAQLDQRYARLTQIYGKSPAAADLGRQWQERRAFYEPVRTVNNPTTATLCTVELGDGRLLREVQCLGDFEQTTATLAQGWQRIPAPQQEASTWLAAWPPHGPQAIGHIGHGLIDTSGPALDNSLTGRMTSPPCVAQAGDWLGFCVGGTASPSCRVRLCDAAGQPLATWGGQDSPLLNFNLINLERWTGQPLHIEIVDEDKEGYLLADRFMILRETN